MMSERQQKTDHEAKALWAVWMVELLAIALMLLLIPFALGWRASPLGKR
jgi:hypothetical protein